MADEFEKGLDGLETGPETTGGVETRAYVGAVDDANVIKLQITHRR